MIDRYKRRILIEKVPKKSDGINIKEILRERKYLKKGYVIRKEIWEFNGEETVMERQAYNFNDEYLGESKFAYRLFKNFGINYTEKKSENHCACTIGFSEKENKWYGWSHRAIYGFGIGSECKKGDCGYNADTKENFMKWCLSFWADSEYSMGDDKAEFTKGLIYNEKSKVDGVLVSYTYNDKVPNERVRGTVYENLSQLPDKWGKGEWTAKTMGDAKQMAIDFSNGVS